MPSSWSESNRLHSSNMREKAAEDALNEYRDSQVEEFIIDEIIEENYEGVQGRFDREMKEDRLFDISCEDRWPVYYPDFE